MSAAVVQPGRDPNVVAFTDRAMRSVRHRMNTTQLPVHRDLMGFDFEVSPVDRKLIHSKRSFHRALA